MGQVSHEQAELLLKLYDLRREARLREARAWITGQFSASTAEEMMEKYPPGSAANANIRMVLGYWEMACGILNRGLMDDELFFETGAEFWFVWEILKPVIPGMRAMYHDPGAFKQIEAAVGRLEQHLNRVAPGKVEAQRERVAQMRARAAKSAQAK